MKLSDNQFKPIHRRRDYSRWVIVKDYIPDHVSLDDVPEIRRKMHIARKAMLHPYDAQPRNYCGSFLVDLGQVKTYPYPKRLWSNSERRQYFAWFDEDASDWKISLQDGTVIHGWMNKLYKESRASRTVRGKELRLDETARYYFPIDGTDDVPTEPTDDENTY
jgi:hypothetical protein